tara:strand:- start:361 stop:570 length:210 start_codon:yes stop_codon:yes gene_type:complete
MLNEDTVDYILEFLKHCKSCRKYHIFIPINVCEGCKKYFCEECGKNMTFDGNMYETISKYCKNCHKTLF